MDRHPRVGLEAEPHPAPLDLQDRDLEDDLQAVRSADHHAFAILSRQHQHGPPSSWLLLPPETRSGAGDSVATRQGRAIDSDGMPVRVDRHPECRQAAAGAAPISVHHDISPVTGEEVLVITLAARPACRERRGR
jgi:hypothetical protein